MQADILDESNLPAEATKRNVTNVIESCSKVQYQQSKQKI